MAKRRTAESISGHTGSSLSLLINFAKNNPVMTHQEEIDAARRRDEGDDKVINEFVERNILLVIYTAKHYSGVGVEMADLIQEGTFGLMRAAERYNPEMGTRFSTYAIWWIRNSMSRVIYNKKRMIRVPIHMEEVIGRIYQIRTQLRNKGLKEPTEEEIAEELGIGIKKVRLAIEASRRPLSLDAPIDGNPENGSHKDMVADLKRGHDENLDERRKMKMIFEEIERLDPRDREIMKQYFGLNEEEKEHTLKSIGDTLDLSRERIRQLKELAILKVRKNLRERLNKEDME